MYIYIYVLCYMLYIYIYKCLKESAAKRRFEALGGTMTCKWEGRDVYSYGLRQAVI